MEVNMKEVYKRWCYNHPGKFVTENTKGRNRTACGYNDEETFFIKEIVKWRSKHHRIPTMLEVFNIARGFGYEKGA